LIFTILFSDDVDDAGAGICGHLSSDVKADQRKRQSTSAASSRSAGAWARTVPSSEIPTSSAIRGILQLRREGLSLTRSCSGE
jgi:hypothetical protein